MTRSGSGPRPPATPAHRSRPARKAAAPRGAPRDGAPSPEKLAHAPAAAPPHPQLALISRVTDRLVRTVDFDEALRTLIDGATELLGVERGSILILDPDSRTLTIRVAKGIEEQVLHQTRIALGDGIAGSVALSGAPLVVQDIRELPLWQQTAGGERRSDYQDNSALCVPLTIHGRVEGVMNFNHKRGRRPFDQADLEFALLIANQAAVALYCAMLHEQFQRQQELEGDLRVARTLQERFLHHPPPQVRGFAFAATCQMCNEVGGDYFDFIPLGDERFVIAIGDAAGHGLGAALLSTDARSALRSSIDRGLDVEDCLFHLNNVVQADTGPEMFMTLIVGVLDARSRRFRFATAGHLMPVVVRRGRLLRLPLMGSNLPLGIRRDLRFVVEQPIELEPGDSMVLFTDGIWEACDVAGRRFGTDVMPNLLEELHDRSPQEVVDHLLAGVAAHRASSELEDDYTLIVARAT